MLLGESVEMRPTLLLFGVVRSAMRRPRLRRSGVMACGVGGSAMRLPHLRESGDMGAHDVGVVGATCWFRTACPSAPQIRSALHVTPLHKLYVLG